MDPLLVFSVACISALLLALALIPTARRLGLVDTPQGHKIHQGKPPVIGGLAMYAAFAITVLPQALDASAPAALIAAGLLVAFGLQDDRVGLRVTSRFAAQGAAAMVMIFAGHVVLRDLGHLISPGMLELGVVSIPLTVFATVGAINAMNMADGVDGLAGLFAFIGFGLLAVVAGGAGRESELLVSVSLMGAVGGFLLLNLRWWGRTRAAVFMGDCGSLFLGLMLAWLCIGLSQGEHRAMTPVTALWIYALPLCDTVALMVRRISLRGSPFRPGRDHLHHLFLAAGFSVSQTVLILASIQATLGVLGLMAMYSGVPEAAMFYAFAAFFGAYYLAVGQPAAFVSILQGISGISSSSGNGVQKIFVGGLSGDVGLDDLARFLGGRNGYSWIQLYRVNGNGRGPVCYAVITPSSEAGRVKLLRELRAQPLVVRPYVKRGRRRRWEQFDRRSHSERCIAEGALS